MPRSHCGTGRHDTSGSFPRADSLHAAGGDRPELQRPAAWAGLNTAQGSGLSESPWNSFCLVSGDEATRLLGMTRFLGGAGVEMGGAGGVSSPEAGSGLLQGVGPAVGTAWGPEEFAPEGWLEARPCPPFPGERVKVHRQCAFPGLSLGRGPWLPFLDLHGGPWLPTEELQPVDGGDKRGAPACAGSPPSPPASWVVVLSA